MYCSYCGKQLSTISRFCPHCGHPLPVSPTIPTYKNGKQIGSRHKKWLLFSSIVFIAIVSVVLVLIFSGHSNTKGEKRIETQTQNLLSRDLGTSVEIKNLYYHEEKQACFVEFRTAKSRDSAAVYLESGNITYMSDFEYNNKKAQQLRKEAYIDEYALHECNQKILECSDLIDWKYVIDTQGATTKNGWVKLK